MEGAALQQLIACFHFCWTATKASAYPTGVDSVTCVSARREFVLGMCDERFERTLVGHGNDATLDAVAKQFAGQLLPLGVVEGGVAWPAMGLRVDVGKQFG